MAEIVQCGAPLRRSALVLIVVFGLTSCAAVERRPAAGVVPPSVASVKPLDISGRISVRQGREGHTGALRWYFDPPHHDIRLLSPLGDTVARIVEDAQGVTLTTADRKRLRANDPDELVEAALGWRLPLRGLQHWVLGLAAPDSVAKTETDEEQRVAKIVQDDWEISYGRFRPVQGTELPGRIVMKRDDIEVRLVVDSWSPVLPTKQ
jgi:outer membrane lipoprotein LolB